jgi:heavy metal sensor kinase
MFNSVRIKLTLWYVGVLTLTLLAFSVGVHALLARNLHRRLDAGLNSALESMRNSLSFERAEGESEKEAAESTVTELGYPSMAMAVFDAEGRLLAERVAPGNARALLPAASAAIAETVRFFTLPGEKTAGSEGWRVAAARVSVAPNAAPYLIVAGQSLEAVAAELKSLRQALALAVPLALALAGIGGWLLARKSLAPVVAMSAQARRIGAGNLDEHLPVANPRDELGQLAVTFNELLGRLHIAFDQQRQFMADASHELRTPLHVIGAAVDVTLQQPARDESDYRDALAMIRQQTRRLTRIVEEMFTLARADAGRRELQVADFYLDELLAETARAAEVLAKPKGVRVALRPANETAFRGDEGLLRQMLLNLLDNAIKHTPADGSVTVSLAQSAASVEITVSDTGAGIPAEAQPHIFERFYRTDKARARADFANGGGAGLGLSIARWIAEAHHGKLELRDSTERGSAFVASLPAAGIR